ncbi:4-hydroxyproline epimerase [Sinomicrobium soli]|uniref:4-hydroxyproline epimerase n=1 Tax=Sinomicrobium sp. N-1-3-6 TaxID=2219864 RepID=UPI000DCD6E29|nr:4-hydroxyproline epimerase [Sinomicrobium sp. N-1-3-6]RAV27625.1 4-hydroxyproline epimerase [Sinomicrobium sp. N-1-3-6]
MARKTFFCVDAHTCGNPVRVVAGGVPFLRGATMSEKRRHFMEEYDWIRRGLMFEPRGHDMMSGSMLFAPSDPQNDAGILFIETSGCLPMCGHGTIGTVTVMIEEGLVTPRVPGELRLETPAGLVRVTYRREGKRVSSVKLTNIKSYLAATGIEVQCPELGPLKVDVAYGGNFYAIVDVQPGFRGLEHYQAGDLISWSRVLRSRIGGQYDFVHPEDPSISGLSHILWTGTVLDPGSTARNAVFYGDKAIDRSPCGTGTSARMAQWYARGKLKKGDDFVHESIIGSVFTGRIEEETELDGKKAIVPSIEGWARVTGYNTIIIDDDDPYAHGFQVL